jgi:hypothetical protein
LIVVGTDGKTVTENARSAVSTYGAKAYPFTDAHLERLQKEAERLEKEADERLKITPIGVPPIGIDELINLLITNSNLRVKNQRC